MSKEQERAEHQEALEVLEELEQDIVEDKPEQPKFKLPPKFEGKSAEEIAQSYTELESAYGKRNNEYGQLRKMADELLELKLKSEASPEGDKPVDVDTLLDDPSKAINDAIDKNPKLREIEHKLHMDALSRARGQFEQKHPDWGEIVADPAFQGWVSETSTRQKMFAAADQNYNYEVGDELLTLYKQVRKAEADQASQNRQTRIKSDLRNAASETGSSTPRKTKVYNRTDLINLRVNHPEKYEAIEAEVRKAYAEGRVR